MFTLVSAVGCPLYDPIRREIKNARHDFVSNFDLQAMWCTLSLSDPACIQRERTDGGQLQGSPFSPRRYFDMRPLVWGGSLALIEARHDIGKNQSGFEMKLRGADTVCQP
jgi:hypothetical protein